MKTSSYFTSLTDDQDILHLWLMFSTFYIFDWSSAHFTSLTDHQHILHLWLIKNDVLIICIYSYWRIVYIHFYRKYLFFEFAPDVIPLIIKIYICVSNIGDYFVTWYDLVVLLCNYRYKNASCMVFVFIL